MIAKEHRFHGHASLAYVYRQGRTVRNQYLGLRFALNSRRTTYRAAVIVSRKVHKAAVLRNLVRRRIYEIIRTYNPPISEPYDMVLTIFSEQVAEFSHERLASLVGELLRRAHVAPSPTKSKPAMPPHGIVKTQEDR